MLKEITLRQALPSVFSGMEKNDTVAQSEIWLRDVSFVKPHRYLVAAESGTGKSSLCSYIYGSRRDYEGVILFDGEDIRSFSIGRWCELRTRSLAYLPQEMELFPELTVMENLEIKNRLTGFRSRNWMMQALERLEIAGKADVKAAFLSVGQQQRVAIVRALCQPFDFLLLDEPVSHLDNRNNSAVAALIAEEADAAGAAVIATSVGNHIDMALNITLKL